MLLNPLLITQSMKLQCVIESSCSFTQSMKLGKYLLEVALSIILASLVYLFVQSGKAAD